MKKFRITAALLALCLLTGCLAGCSGPKSTPDTTAETPKPSTVTRQEAQTVSTKYAYTAKYIDLPDAVDYVNASCINGDALYFIANVVSGQETYTDEVTGEEYSYDAYSNQLFRLDLNTEVCQQLNGYQSSNNQTDDEGWQINSYVQAMAAGTDDTVWLCEQTSKYRYNLPENFDPATDEQWNYYEDGGSSYRIIQLDSNGAQLNELSLSVSDIPELASRSDRGDFYIGSFFIDANGYIYASDWEFVCLWDKDGKLLHVFDTSDSGSQLMQYSATQIGVITYGETRGLKLIDPVKLDWGETIELPSHAYDIFPGDDAYDLYYNYNGKIYGYNAETDTEEKVVDWMECDINSNSLDSYTVLPDGRVFAVVRDWDSGSGKTQIVILTRTDASALPEKTVLTLACMYLDYNLRSQIIKFNQSSSQYRIVVKDYSEYITDDENGYDNALTRFNTEILSGSLPDMLVGSSLPIDRYAAKGMLVDLWQFIDADESISREDLMTPVLDAMSIDGKLYSIASSFSIETAVGMGKVVGEYDNWTLTEVRDAMTKLQPDATIFSESATKSDILSSCITRNISSFINWETGECSFDSPEFIELLNFANEFPAEFDYDNYNWDTDYESDYKRMREGRQLLSNTYLSDFGSVYVQYAALNDDVCYIGFPSGSAHSEFNIDSPLSITTACADKDAAWAFIRSVLSDDYQSSIWSFPISRKAFEAAAAKAMEQEYETDANGNKVLDENGEPIKVSMGGYGFGGDEMYDIYAMTQEQYDDLLSLIASTTRTGSYDTSIMAIINQETGAFFNGEKSAEDTAKIIQSRVKLYVAEQR